MIYYHGTSKENANKIKEHGINSLESKYDGKIYLTTNYAEASKYGKIASNGKPGIVLKIHSDALTPEHIHSSNSGIIEYKGNIHKDHISEETNVGMIAGTGDSRLPADQREPALNINIKNNKKILRRRKLTTHLDELSKGLLGRYIKKASGSKMRDIGTTWKEAGRAEMEEPSDFYQKRGSPYTTSQVVDRIRRKISNRDGGINNALKRLTKEDTAELINSVIEQSPSDFYNIFSEIVNAKIDRYIDVMNEDIAADLFESNRLDEKILASKTAYVENPKSGFRRIKGLTGEEKKHIDNFGTVVFDSKKPEDGRKGNTWRRVVKGRWSYYPRKLSNNELPLVYKEDTSELIRGKYTNENTQLDELSRGTLMNYIRAANHRGHAERIMQGQAEADRTYYSTGRRTKDFKDQFEKKSQRHGKKAWQHQLGIDRAIDRLAKKDAE